MLLYVLMVFIASGIGITSADFNIDLGDLYGMQKGLGWPGNLHVVQGHEALMKLAATFDNQDRCEITTPDGQKFDVNHPPNDRFESWSECGVRLKNVQRSDYGRWRITATAGNESLTGWVEMFVEEYIKQYSGSSITLQDGQTHAEVELSTLQNSYCVVEQPFTESALVPGHCKVTLDRTTRAVQGNWHVLLGLPGRVTELQVDRSVSVETERLDVGFVRESNPNKLHLYCNILHTVKNITFCRFQKTNARAGFNVIDGLSDGRHSYYGDGFAKRHCGITIEQPTQNDYGTWKCTVGVQEWVGTTITQKTPLQALIRVVASGTPNNRYPRDAVGSDKENDRRTIFVQYDMTVSISCQADASLSYCWFQHPNGTQFTPVLKVDEDQLFWYSGESLQTGSCGITFTHVTEQDSGVWTCHMGPRDQVGVEMTDSVSVRVTGPLAAREKEMTVTLGDNATLYCHSANGNRPLEYCRFLSPHYIGISVDSSITYENAILDRYYFTPGRELNYGDCSLSIYPVQESDVGVWTCAAMVDNETLESRDTIMLHVQQAETPRLRAGLIGMGAGLGVLGIILFGGLFYKYGRHHIPDINIPWRRTNNTNVTEDRSLQVHFDNVSRSSTSSQNSGDNDIFNNLPSGSNQSRITITNKTTN